MKNALGDFYKRIATFTPQAHGVPQGKYIERSFGTEWHQVLKAMPSNNYAGKNIRAKEQLSVEYVVEASKNYPTKAQMPDVVAQFINVMRMKPNPKTGISRQAEWLQAFHASEKSKAKAISAEVKLQLMGKKYLNPKNPDNSLLTITSKGLMPTINGETIKLDLDDHIIYQHNGKKVEVHYDPEKLDEFLVTDGNGLRFMAGPYRNMPAAIADYQPGDRQRIEQAWDAKKHIGNLMSEVVTRRIAASKVTDLEAQSLIQQGVLLKDVKQDAENLYIESQYTRIQQPTGGYEIAEDCSTKAPVTTNKKSHYDNY
jgi:hypothetical protein